MPATATHRPASRTSDLPALLPTSGLTASAPTAPRPARPSARPVLPSPLPAAVTAPVVFSYGMGVDSTAILLRWITDPESRDFPLSDLVVVTAMTGDEWEQTGADVEEHVLPLLRAHRVRYVQAARAGRSVARDGLVVLSDTDQPDRLHLAGAYRLSDELLEAGTIPQTGGKRACSIHAKGDVLDPVIAALTAGRPYRHVVGFEAGERRRADKDAGYNTATRTGEYPLIEWGWDRQRCLDFIAAATGASWSKSSCRYCPFAMTHKAGLSATLARYATVPQAAVHALLLEHVALALNPAQGLIAGRRLVDALAEAGHHHVLDLFERQVAGAEHALYEVRRVLRARADDPTRMSNAARSVRRLATGTREEMLTELHAQALAHHLEVAVGEDGHSRGWAERRGPLFPTREAFLVAAPAVVLDKRASHFDDWWGQLEPFTDHEAAPVPLAPLASTLF